MARMNFIEIDGKRYLWRDLLQLRREQRKAHARAQPALFELPEDCRPTAERTAAGRSLGAIALFDVVFCFFAGRHSLSHALLFFVLAQGIACLTCSFPLPGASASSHRAVTRLELQNKGRYY